MSPLHKNPFSIKIIERYDINPQKTQNTLSTVTCLKRDVCTVCKNTWTQI